MKGFIINIIVFLSTSQVFCQTSKEIELIEFNQSACDKTSDPYRLKSRIISLSHKSDTLQIEIGFAATCCIDYVPKIKFLADTLFFSYDAKDEDGGCFCICCYSFIHKIKGIPSKNIIVKLYEEVIELSDEKYKTFPPTYTIVRGDTVNIKDKYGLKQGTWVNEISFTRYKNDRILSWGRFYENGKVQNEHDLKTDIYREFHPNGKLKMKCNKTPGQGLTNCQQWYESGKEKF
jgi:hypothetical protein